MGSLGGVERQKIRVFLVIALLVSAGFAAWSWMRPYEWGADPGARCKVAGAQVRKDQAFHWLDLHVKVTPGQTHDLLKPVRLVAAGGGVVDPAETTIGGEDAKGTTDLWFKFWLDESVMKQSLKLRINDGELTVRKHSGLPDLGESQTKVFPTCNW